MKAGPEDRAEDKAHTALLAQAIKSIRKARRMRPSEVAAAMGLPLRTYEHFERGTGKLSYARISRFAQATDSDPIAIMSVLPLRSDDFALNCADNKLMTIATAAFRELNDELGGDLGLLRSPALVVAFDKLVRELIAEVRQRDRFAERWLAEKASKLDGVNIRPPRS